MCVPSVLPPHPQLPAAPVAVVLGKGTCQTWGAVGLGVRGAWVMLWMEAGVGTKGFFWWLHPGCCKEHGSRWGVLEMGQGRGTAWAVPGS